MELRDRDFLAFFDFFWDLLFCLDLDLEDLAVDEVLDDEDVEGDLTFRFTFLFDFLFRLFFLSIFVLRGAFFSLRISTDGDLSLFILASVMALSP